MKAVKSAFGDMVISFFWVILSATFGIQTAAIISATGFHGITWAPPVISTLVVFVSISIFTVIGDFLGGASFNPCANAAFYTVGVSGDSLFSLAIRAPAQAVGAAGGAITIMEMIPEKYKTMIGGGPSLQVDAHIGAIAEVILSFCVTFLVLLIILRGPRKLLAKTFLLSIATVSVFIVGSKFTRPFMNPAIAFGWAYIYKSHNTWDHFYVYWFSSFTGAILSAMLFRIVFPPPPPVQKKQKKA
ncbi:putative aquaporin SIP1-2 [Cardamine amara subsp. amara]|uniref:Aquaporin SIP1-2 n=1 Tax=Cardamine amara subsp. amara TaxID=228776 RepID=A0ABD1AVY6_CARAN